MPPKCAVATVQMLELLKCVAYQGVKLHSKETHKRGYCGQRITVTRELSNPK